MSMTEDEIRADEREKVAQRIEAVDYAGDCDCGHDLGLHNGLGCYAKDYPEPGVVVKCLCMLDDDRDSADLAQERFARIARNGVAVRADEPGVFPADDPIGCCHEPGGRGLDWRGCHRCFVETAHTRIARNGADR